MIGETENRTITDFTTYQPPKQNLKHLIGYQAKMENVIVNSSKYFGTGYWLAKKNVFSKKTQEKLQVLTDKEVKDIDDRKENRTYLRIQANEESIHNMAVSGIDQDYGFLTPIRVVKNGLGLGVYLFDIILLKTEDGDITILNAGIYNTLNKEGIRFCLTDNKNLISLFKDNTRVGVMCPLSRKVFDYLPEDMAELETIEKNQLEAI